MQKKLLFSYILLSGILLYTGCAKKQIFEVAQTTDIQPIVNHVPSYTSTPTSIQSTPLAISSITGKTHQLKTIQGQAITIVENGNVGFKFPQFAGKIIIFQIFGKDCEYCFEEMPIINRIKSQYGSRVEVVAIQAQDRMSPSVASTIMRQYHINYPIIEGDDAQDLLRFLTETYGWTGILPYILLIKDGATEYNFSDGGVGYQEFRESIESLL